MKIVATTSLPAVDRPNADRWNAARSRQKYQYHCLSGRRYCLSGGCVGGKMNSRIRLTSGKVGVEFGAELGKKCGHNSDWCWQSSQWCINIDLLETYPIMGIASDPNHKILCHFCFFVSYIKQIYPIEYIDFSTIFMSQKYFWWLDTSTIIFLFQ